MDGTQYAATSQYFEQEINPKFQTRKMYFPLLPSPVAALEEAGSLHTQINSIRKA